MQMPVNVQYAAFRQAPIQRAVWLVTVRLDDRVRRFVSQQNVSEDHRVAAKIESGFHPSGIRPLPIVVAAYQNLSTGQTRHYPVRLFTYLDIAQVYDHIFRLDSPVPVLYQQLRKIIRSVAIGLHVLMVEVRVGYQVYVHLVFLFKPVRVPVRNLTALMNVHSITPAGLLSSFFFSPLNNSFGHIRTPYSDLYTTLARLHRAD